MTGMPCGVPKEFGVAPDNPRAGVARSLLARRNECLIKTKYGLPV